MKLNHTCLFSKQKDSRYSRSGEARPENLSCAGHLRSTFTLGGKIEFQITSNHNVNLKFLHPFSKLNVLIRRLNVRFVIFSAKIIRY